MWWYLIPAGIGLCALVIIAVLLYRAFPRLIVIDVKTIASERDRDRKHQIILERAERLRASLFHRAEASLRPRIKAMSETVLTWYKKAVEFEKQHRHVGVSEGSGDANVAHTLVEEAKAFAKVGSAREAEEKYIQAIAMAPRHAKAYEELGRFYVAEKQWDEAAEAFQFLLKMDVNDASAHANIGELAMAKGEIANAIPHFLKAVEIKSANPRLQALLLEAAIQSGQKDLAVQTFAHLKELAPQYPSAVDFEERIRRM